MKLVKTILRLTLSLAVACLINPGAAQSQTGAAAKPADESQTLRVLLDEVHQLRLALQRLTVSSSRVQVLGERVRLLPL